MLWVMTKPSPETPLQVYQLTTVLRGHSELTVLPLNELCFGLQQKQHQQLAWRMQEPRRGFSADASAQAQASQSGLGMTSYGLDALDMHQGYGQAPSSGQSSSYRSSSSGHMPGSRSVSNLVNHIINGFALRHSAETQWGSLRHQVCQR